ncbi:CBL-interacting protein kinase 29 [Brachypodium distachyon]|uniref:non-specific serine/threonine protein kinase n=1 Tax=Brachypodium distachyon TaxID=15368 RepID=I1GR60_BRADI|nr:CBL-interacting protein kinase 29 [Brachypodium distachyon]KQK14650.1 hypothetical protein BRADI_1g17810v3 [Brachypodium distachyon]|eukprot:XP_010233961.1 CBL-interacting protein kinase 29 [Brachypodium distachyon]
MPPAASPVPPSAAAAAPAADDSSAANAVVVLGGRYELGAMLGRGASAKVYQARDLVNGGDVAIKSFPNPGSGGGGAIEREAAILRRLRHRHVVRLHEILGTRKKVHFVLDLASGGELFSLVDASGRMAEPLARRYFQQLISAVRYCHSRGVFHRDIKPENLLLDANGSLKVADFGLGTIISPNHSNPPQQQQHTLCGTPAYVAPEILAKQGYDPAKVDLWSCGVVLFVLAAGYLPFNDASLVNMYRKIYAGRFRCPPWFSRELRDLLRRILDPNPATRVSADGILSHPWFRGGASEGELADLMRDEDEEEEFKEEEDMMGREMTAFDILGFSPGSDLSGMFGAGPGRERVFVGEPAAKVMGRVEEVGRKAGFQVRKKEGKAGNGGGGGVVFVESGNGGVVAKVIVFRIAEEVSVVEVAKGHGDEAARFWKEWLEPAMKAPAAAL